jgi:hypothetical protein
MSRIIYVDYTGCEFDPPLELGNRQANKREKRRRWYCPRCDRYMRFPRPATDMVAYATTGRVYKCWWCYMEVHPVEEVDE